MCAEAHGGWRLLTFPWVVRCVLPLCRSQRDMLDRLALDNPDAFRDTISNCMSVRIKRSHCVAERTTISLECVA